MTASIKLISVNIERSKHLDKVIPFLKSQLPEVVCMQELCEKDIARISDALSMEYIFAPCGVHPTDVSSEPDPLVGIGIFTSLAIRSRSAAYYAGSEEEARSAPAHATFTDNPLAFLEVEKDARMFRIATTHFTWTPDGSADDRQRHAVGKLLESLAASDDVILCGDFNAPRIYHRAPGEIFSRIAGEYRDNIPVHYMTSVDVALHRNGATAKELSERMVDGLFTSPPYAAEDVRLVSGVSDHCAIVATVRRD